ncbi:hypothetical protein [Novipirellula caenicola]|uniref:DNA ligase D 3'-phosphoesterase domain-containing protein n=1 Tax=Novipirellula caenicola TaxID=1536901 RepID=A0ABP9VTE7_9BACT
MNAIQPRFVILRHTPGSQATRGPESPAPVPPHFDWMFEVDGVLKTWATEPLESFAEGISTKVEKLADHRVHYLDFQGDIGGDRGEVRQVISGHYRKIEIDTELFVAEITWRDARGQTQSRHVEIAAGYLLLKNGSASAANP